MTAHTTLLTYMGEVDGAQERLNAAHACLDGQQVVTLELIKAHHENVSAAHKRLRRACRYYRRRRLVRIFWVTLEQHAVALGYLTFDEVERL